MTIPRKYQINLSETLYYHCIGRCVRRAFLYGKDPHTKRSYDHRKKWVIEHLHSLCTTFAIRVCAYAVMSNHYHLVLCVEPDEAKKWSDEEVIIRYRHLNMLRTYGGAVASNKNEKTSDEVFTPEQIATYRNKLMDISTFMGVLNEHLSRKANREDNCTGRFWDGRFKSMALLDDAALLTCMAYVDLNPIRAGMALSLEESDFTSIQERLFSHSQTRTQSQINNKEKSVTNPGLKEMLGIFHRGTEIKKSHIPCSWEDYYQLVEWTGRQIRGDKKGYIPPDARSLLAELSIHPESWISRSKRLEKIYSWAIGSFEKLKKLAERNSLQSIRGMREVILKQKRRLQA